MNPLRWTILALDHLATRVGWQPQLDPDQIVQAACRTTGLHDLGDQPYPDSLAIACRSLRDEANLRPSGTLVLRATLIQAVTNRLRLVEARARHPEVFTRPLRPPLVVLGLPRTGTTLLSRTLAHLPGSRGVEAWRVRQPIHLGGLDVRRTTAKLGMAYLNALSPDIAHKHTLDADAFEEEVGFFDASLWLKTLWRFASCPTYQQWLMAQDARPAYRDFRDVLLWLQAEQPDARFVLKLPNHLGWTDALLEAIPEAMFVRTHRAPTSCIASYASLASSVWEVFAHRVDRHALGAASLDLWSTYARRFEAVRPHLRGRLLELPYEELIRDVPATLAKSYRHFGLPWAEPQARVATTFLRVNQAHRAAHQRHEYALEDYGLSEAEVEAAFAGTSEHL